MNTEPMDVPYIDLELLDLVTGGRQVARPPVAPEAQPPRPVGLVHGLVDGLADLTPKPPAR